MDWVSRKRMVMLFVTAQGAALIMSVGTASAQEVFKDQARLAVVRSVASKKTITRTSVSFSGEASRYQLTEVKYDGHSDIAESIALDGHGNPWFLSSWGDSEIQVDRHTLEFREFRLPKGCEPHFLAIDRNGAHWIVSWSADALFEIHPQDGFGIIHKPPSPGFINFVVADPRHAAVWFIMPGNNFIGRFHHVNGLAEYPLPTSDAGSGKLDIDSKGNVWFPELYANKLARLDTTIGRVTEYPLPTPNALPVFVFVDSHDAVWVSEHRANKIGRFKDGNFEEYALPTQNSGPTAITEAHDGSIWFVEGGWHGTPNSNRIAKLDFRYSAIRELLLPTPNSQPSAIAIDQVNNVWIVESGTGRIGLLQNHPVGENAGARRKASNKS